MSIESSKEMLLKAKKGKYAVCAFNVENMEMVKAVIEAAEETKSPVILQTTPSTVKYGTLKTFYSMVSAEAYKVSVPVCLHLDHGDSYNLAIEAMNEGYTSVMIDGSHESFEDNIILTKRVKEVAQILGVPVEAELGKVGGKEDDLIAIADANTNPVEAKEFVERTGVDSLAIAIGTAHGFYEGVPILDKKRVSDINKVVSIPLVLHGASGLSDEDVMECIERGISKVNFATELRVAYTDAVKKLLKDHGETFDPKKLGLVGMENVKKLAIERMKVCGCFGKA